VAGHKNIGVQGQHSFQHLNPCDSKAPGHVWKFIQKENFAEICNPVLRNEDDAVSSSVGRTEIQNLNFLTAQVQAHAITKGGIRHSCALFFRGQLAALRSALLQGAMAHDFGTELWTLKRVRALIERLYGVRFSEVHVWRLLGAMGFSSQKPERRAIERDEAAVLAWKRKTWPALKKSVPPSGE